MHEATKSRGDEPVQQQHAALACCMATKQHTACHENRRVAAMHSCMSSAAPDRTAPQPVTVQKLSLNRAQPAQAPAVVPASPVSPHPLADAFKTTTSAVCCQPMSAAAGLSRSAHTSIGKQLAALCQDANHYWVSCAQKHSICVSTCRQEVCCKHHTQQNVISCGKTTPQNGMYTGFKSSRGAQ
jgi:hypothetical protein